MNNYFYLRQILCGMYGNFRKRQKRNLSFQGFSVIDNIHLYFFFICCVQYLRIGSWSLRFARRWRTWNVRRARWQTCMWLCRRCPAGPCQKLWPAKKKKNYCKIYWSVKRTPPWQTRKLHHTVHHCFTRCGIIIVTLSHTWKTAHEQTRKNESPRDEDSSKLGSEFGSISKRTLLILNTKIRRLIVV